MKCKMTLTACAAALLAGCATQEAPKTDNIVEYEAVLDRVHVRNDSLTQYGNTRAGAGIRQGEEYVHTLWGEHEAGETNEEKMAHALGYESPKEREARLAREKAAREAALKRAAEKKARDKNAKKRRAGRNGRDQSIYAYDQSVYGEKAPVVKKTKESPSAAKRFVEKTTLTFPKKETSKEAVQNGPVTPTQTQAATPAKVIPAAVPVAEKTTAVKPVVVTETVNAATEAKANEPAAQEKIPSVAPVEKAVEKQAEAVKSEVKEAAQANVEDVKESPKAAGESATAETKPAVVPTTRHMINPVIRNSGVNDTPRLAPTVTSDEPAESAKVAPEGNTETQTTDFGHPDGESAPDAEVQPANK